MHVARVCLAALLLSACSKAPPPAAVDDDPMSGTPYARSERPPPVAVPMEPAAPESAKPGVRYKDGKLVADNTAPVLRVTSEFDNYVDGRLLVPAYPGDLLYLSLTVATEAGTPLADKAIEISSKAGSQVMLLAPATNKEGYLDFRILASKVGRDEITVTGAGVKTRFGVDVQAPPTGEWLQGLDVQGVTSWDLLMSAELNVQPTFVEATFPPAVQKLKDGRLRLAGFMLPLESTARQKHFLFSANPPSCFFHPPGGPSSVVEVFAAEGITASFDPMVIEGTLQMLGHSPGGIIYQLRNVKLISKI